MRSVSVKDMLFDGDSFGLGTSGRNSLAEFSCRHELPRHEHLELDVESTNLRYSIGLVRHEPQHSLCTYVPIGMPKVIRFDCRMAHHHRGPARHNQDACAGTHRSLQCCLDPDECRFHIGVPNLRKALPILFVDQGRMQACAGIKNQNVRCYIRDGTIDHRRVGCIARNSTGSDVACIAELGTVAGYDRNLRTPLHEGLCHFQSDACAATSDYDFCGFQVDHNHSSPCAWRV